MFSSLAVDALRRTTVTSTMEAADTAAEVGHPATGAAEEGYDT